MGPTNQHRMGSCVDLWESSHTEGKGRKMGTNQDLWTCVMGSMTRACDVNMSDISDNVDAAIEAGLGHWIVIPDEDPTNHDAAGGESYESECDALDAIRYLDTDVAWMPLFVPADRASTIRRLEKEHKRILAREMSDFAGS